MIKRNANSLYQMKTLQVIIRIDKTKEDLLSLGNYVEKIIDWESFYNLAKLNRHQPFIYKELKRLNLEQAIPGNVKEKFELDIERINDVNQKRIDEAKNFLQVFSRKNIPVIMLKGIYYAEKIYKDPYYKRMNDVDILINKTDLKEIIKTYQELGYFSAGELLGKSAQEYDQFSHHLPPFFSKNLNLMIGTHWGLHSSSRDYSLDYESIWQRAVHFDFYDIPIKSLSDVDHLHHLCIHLDCLKVGSREVGDIVNLLRFSSENFNWSLFNNLVKQSKSYNPVFFALSLAQLLDPTNEKLSVLNLLKSEVSSSTLNIVAEKTKSLETLLYNRSAHVSNIDKAFTNFKTTKIFNEKLKYYLRMYKSMLLPPKQEALKICNLNNNESTLNNLKSRFIAPIRIISILCNDLGVKTFILLIFYTAFKLIQSFFKTLFSKNLDGQKQYLDRLGIGLEDLENLQKRLE